LRISVPFVLPSGGLKAFGYQLPTTNQQAPKC